MAEKVVRKKTTKKTTTKTTRKRVAKMASVERAAETTTRKAPTTIASNRADTMYTRKVIALSSVLFLVFVGISVAVGFSGDGEIEVSREYERQLSVATDEERAAIEKASNPPQPRNNLPMGGLIGAKTGGTNPPKPAPVAQTGTSTASSTDTASTTERVAGESTENTNGAVTEGDTAESDSVEPTSSDSAAPTEETTAADTDAPTDTTQAPAS